MNRRKFIKSSAAGIGGLSILPSCVNDISTYCFFTINEAKCLIALTEQIIPTDENGPGAKYANVINYIDRQLVKVFISDQQNYRIGIRAFQKTCKKMYNQRFEELDFDLQTAFLHKLEDNNLPGDYWDNNKPSVFFNMVIKHTMQGYYGSPRHGGNKNYLSYRMLGIDYPLVIGQNRYRGMNEK